MGGTLVLLGVVIAWVLSGSLTRPLARLTATARHIAGGHYGTPTGVGGRKDEIGVLARALDIMQEQVAQTTGALREERDIMDAVLGSVEAGILMTDLAGNRVFANARWREVLGEGDLLAADHLLRAGEATTTLAEAARGWLAQPNREVTADFECPEPAYRRFRCYSAPVYHHDRSQRERRVLGRLFVLRDVTRESEVERLRAAFVASVSHELRSPLTAIKGYTATLLEGGPWEGAIQEEFLEIVAASADKLATLVDNLLDAAQFEAGVLRLNPEPVRVERIAQQVVAHWAPLSPDHRLRLEAPPGMPLAEADPLRVEQVLTNLVENAIKYSPAGGPITIQVAEDEGLTISVRDHGIGIAPEEAERLFERFYRGNNGGTPAVKGLGLGLFICKSLVEAHSGRIWVESQPGVGSTFYFTLPKLEDTAMGKDSIVDTKPSEYQPLLIEEPIA